MTPPYAHMHFAVWLNAGLLAIKTVGHGGTHGAGMTGMQVPGVRTPRAAAVCAAVMGFARLVHTPNGMMFLNGTLSMMVATGLFSNSVLPSGVTMNALGATPNEHISWAPATTGSGTAATVVRRACLTVADGSTVVSKGWSRRDA